MKTPLDVELVAREAARQIADAIATVNRTHGRVMALWPLDLKVQDGEREHVFDFVKLVTDK